MSMWCPPTDLNSKNSDWRKRTWKADSQKEEKINITHMKSMRRTENIMFHFIMVKKEYKDLEIGKNVYGSF